MKKRLTFLVCSMLWFLSLVAQQPLAGARHISSSINCGKDHSETPVGLVIGSEEIYYQQNCIVHEIVSRLDDNVKIWEVEGLVEEVGSVIDHYNGFFKEDPGKSIFSKAETSGEYLLTLSYFEGGVEKEIKCYKLPNNSECIWLSIKRNMQGRAQFESEMSLCFRNQVRRN